MKINSKAAAGSKTDNTKTVESLFLTVEKQERIGLPEGELNQVLPESLIPGQKGFNEKRLQDIENIENDRIKKRAGEETKVPTIVKKSMKLVKKMFKK